MKKLNTNIDASHRSLHLQTYIYVLSLNSFADRLYFRIVSVTLAAAKWIRGGASEVAQ